MKFTLSWLKEHLDTDASLQEICNKLTALGLEVEGVADRAAALAPFRIARVLTADKHPDADKLRVLTVDDGERTLQVVCGAPNARAGLVGVFASEGAYIPGSKITLKKGVIRGVESNGMMCSKRELELSDDHDGIIELPEDAPVGANFAAWAGLDDPVIEIALTPDRADCAGVRGVARDLAAAGLGTLKPQDAGRIDARPVPGAFPSPLGVTIERTDYCPMFAVRYFRGVKNGPSPQWLQDRLTAIGLRPISALVDVTNYVTHDASRPLHVFDADKIRGGLVVRMARDGETLQALNGKTYALDPEIVVVADHEKAEGLGGVMGGEATGCTGETVNVLLEVALFDGVRTARTGRRLGVDSDARYRFDRGGVDPAGVLEGVERATRLILDLCGGEVSDVAVAGAEPEWRRVYTLRPGRVAALGGVDVPADEQARILTALGCEVAAGADGTFAVVPPSWRGDVLGEADLVEEVLRVVGFDAVPATPLPRPPGSTKPALSPKQRRTSAVRRALADRGLNEAVTWAFMASGDAAPFGGAADDLKLLNPISADLDVMRPSALPNLIKAAGRNVDRGFADAALFEVGPAFRNATPQGQDATAAGVRVGAASPRHWAEKTRPVDAFDAKADALAALEAAGASTAGLQTTADAPGWYHPGRSGQFRLGPTVIARFGEIHPSALEALGVKGPVAAFEVLLDAVPQPKKKPGTAKPLLVPSAFQPVERDFAFLVDAGVEADRIVRAVKGADKTLIAGVSVFDVYVGKGVEPGKKSIGVAVALQPTDRTLTDADIEAAGQKIVAAVVKATGGALRG